MTRFTKTLRTDQRGAAIVEFAMILPFVIVFIWGIFQVGLLFQAYAGMQHALGEAARYATIFPTPTDEQIKATVAGRKFGTGNGTLAELSITDGSSGGTGTQYKTLSLTYSQPLDFLFFQAPGVTLTQSKVVYLAS